ncbi:hypothetical protein [Streptomyces californicus]|uniref:hypothetical protein n=1 Tax=Streptomyces californicus TaxID=67351 RepID=UPI0037AE5CE0
MPIETTAHAIEAAAYFGEHKGALASLARGDIPSCFAGLDRRLNSFLSEARATEAELSMADGPDDALWERGKSEMAEIARAASDLHAWVQTQRCSVDICECRADRLLRLSLRDRHVAHRAGYSPQLQRVATLVIGHSDSLPFAFVHSRNRITHPVRQHSGWQARLVTPDGVSPLYESPGYPGTPLSLFYDDTQACFEAVITALGR